MAVSKHNIVQNHMLHDSEWSQFFFGRGLRALFLFPSIFFVTAYITKFFALFVYSSRQQLSVPDLATCAF